MLRPPLYLTSKKKKNLIKKTKACCLRIARNLKNNQPMIGSSKVFGRRARQVKAIVPLISTRLSSSILVPAYINGSIVADSSQSFAVTSPWTNTELHRAHNTTIEHALAAAEAAGTAGMKTWGSYAPAQRRDILLRAANVSTFHSIKSFSRRLLRFRYRNSNV